MTSAPAIAPEAVTPDHSVADVIEALGGPTALATSMGFKHPSTVSEMKRSGSIPGRYWRQIVDIAKAAGVKWITTDVLAEMHSAPPKRTAEVA